MIRKTTLVLALALTGASGTGWAQGTPVPGAPGARPSIGVPQAAGQIRGAVLSAASGQPLRSASVAVWSAVDSTLVTGTLTGADGSFRIEGLRPGRYYVKLSALGFEPTTKTGVTLTPAAQQVELGQVRLASSAVQIEGLAITGEKREVTLAPDRNTYSVRDMPAASGGNAVDVLRNVPSVEVDGDNKVSLRGNENVVVQINGRPSPMRGDQLGNFLAQLPSNMVEKVEVIPNPSAKYDPEGMAGIINIQLKQNTDLGLSGGLTFGAGTTGQLNGSGNLGYQSGPLTLFGSYGYMNDEREVSGINNRENRYLTPLTYLESEMIGAMSPKSHNLNASGELQLGGRNVLSTNLLLSKRDFTRGNNNFYRELDADRALIGRYNRLNEGTSDDLTLDYALTFKHTAEPRRNELSTELRFNRSVNDNFSLLTDQALLIDGTPADDRPGLETNGTDGVSDNWTLQADWTRVLGGGTKLETGYKGTLRQLDNDFEVARFSYDQDEYESDLTRSNEFEYDEQVHAAYGVISRNQGKFDLQAGLRLEQAATRFDLATTDETFDNDYRSFFPSALVAFNADDARQLKVSYSKRVTRPDTRVLNPFAFYEDPLNRFQGNPYLNPEYTHAFELGYQQSFEKGSLQITPFYRHTVDAVRRIRTLEDDGVSTTSFANVATSDSYGGDVNGSLRLGRLSGFGGFSAFKQVTDGSNLSTDVSNEAIGWSARANASFRISSTLDVQGFVMYRAPMNVEQGRISSMTMTNIALRQKLMGDRASLSLRVMDPFDRMGMGFETSDARFYQETQRKFGARGVFLTFSYNFGQQPRVRQQRPVEQTEPRQDEMGGL